jgi:hypothetical protein
VSGAGKVIIVQSEGDLILSDAEQLRAVIGEPDYRIIEVAGSAHIPEVSSLTDNPIAPILAGTNPTDWPAVARAAFLAGDAWVRTGASPPPSQVIATDPSGAPDPVYGVPTGIARDANLNALGGVRMPDVELGTDQFIPADFGAAVPGLLGDALDLRCVPLANGQARFDNHGDYVNQVARIVNGLTAAGYLLQSDAREIKSGTAKSDVGAPGACPN